MKRDFEHNMVSESLVLTGSTAEGYTSLLERISSKTKIAKQKSKLFPTAKTKGTNKY